MALTIELPHVGESVVEGTIGKWLKQPGDPVRRYEPLVEVITDKVTMEVPSPVAGSLLRVFAEEGETIPMGAPLAEMETDEAPPKTATPTSPEVGAPAAVPQRSEAPPQTVSTTGYLVKDVAPVGPTGGGPTPEGGVELGSPGAPATPMPGDGVRLSPAVRRLIQEHGIDASLVPGSGLGGRVTRNDVLKYIEGRPEARPETRPAPPPEARPDYARQPSREQDQDQDEERAPLTPVRRMIAEAMVRSVTQIPHAWSMVDADVTGLVELRSRVREEFQRREGLDLSYLPFIITAVVQALKEHPTLNASWGGDAIVLKKRVNLGIAVAAPAGLIVPVIHDADRLSTAGLALALQDVTQRARQNKLTLEDVHGGTFTLNNTGALGSVASQPIINPPQAAILTTEAIQKRPVIRDDAIAIRSVMNLCLSFDHRINDGAESGGFLQAVKGRLESLGPDTAFY